MNLPDIQLPKTPFNDILRRNCTVSSSCKAQIDAIVSVIDGLEQELDPEIHRIQVTLAELLAKKNALRDQARMLVGLYHPVRKLPAEILAEIFLQCIDTPWLHDIGRGDYPDGDPMYADEVIDVPPSRFIKLCKMPLALSGVCTLWRKVALARSELWSSISLVIEPKHQTTDALLMGLWLDRACEQQLFIHLSAQESMEHGSHDMSEILNLFASRSQQWHAVELLLTSSMMQHFSSIRHRLPKLQWLSLGYTDNGMHTVHVFEMAPLLVSFQHAENAWPGAAAVPWDRLRHCDLGCSGSPGSYLRVLRNMQVLETCRLLVSSGHEDFDLNIPPFDLPRLRSLTVTENSTDPFPQPFRFFSIFKAPALRELSIQDQLFGVEAFQFLVPWIQHHSNLQILTLRAGSWDWDNYHTGMQSTLHMIEAITDLRELHLLNGVFPGISEALMRALRGASLPKLELLVVEYDPSASIGRHQPPMNILKFVDAVSCRLGTSLRQVKIICDNDQSQSQLAAVMATDLPLRIAELRHAGLDITMTYFGENFYDESTW
ncbi:hypothetical protein HWV62_5245 [Athelia sp. TMB]|nr:hypothetical protein HWV62_5245 [Athelia sp. TMB]